MQTNVFVGTQKEEWGSVGKRVACSFFLFHLWAELSSIMELSDTTCMWVNVDFLWHSQKHKSLLAHIATTANYRDYKLDSFFSKKNKILLHFLPIRNITAKSTDAINTTVSAGHGNGNQYHRFHLAQSNWRVRNIFCGERFAHSYLMWCHGDISPLLTALWF